MAHVRKVDDAFVLHAVLDVVGQGAGDLGGVAAAHAVIDALPLGHPRLLGVGDGDQAFEDLGGAALDAVGGALELEERAVGAALLLEALS